jgi:hypothetical protein
MCVVAEGGKIYSFGEKKRVGTPFSMCVCLPIRVGKAPSCTALCTHFWFTIKYRLEEGVSAEKYCLCLLSTEGYLM